MESLLELQDSPIHQKAINQIKYRLANSIKELVEKTKNLAIMLSNNLEKE